LADQKATLLVRSRIWTANPAQPWADAAAVVDDRIVAVGNADEAKKLIGPDTQVIDAGDGLVVPGLIDSHIHLTDGGLRLSCVQLRDAKTRDEFVRRIAHFAKSQPAGTWITRDWIDSVTPDHPVWINRLDGHMALANTAAMRAAKVGDDVTDVAGGEIVRDSEGRPTGVFKDNAMGRRSSCSMPRSLRGNTWPPAE
jgi:predicted amidohydrolase YtcJ